jgi:aminomethyltransferase
VFDDDAAVGDVTRAAEGPTRAQPLALALVDVDAADRERLTVRVDGEEQPATVERLPFVEGSDASARTPTYPNG